jgi:hypothetical protein
LGFYVGNVEFDESVYDVGDNSSARGGLAKVGSLGMDVFAHAKDRFQRWGHHERFAEESFDEMVQKADRVVCENLFDCQDDPVLYI